MLKKTITYTTFDEEEVKDDFFFNLTRAELVELEMSKEGGFQEWLKNVIKADDGKTIMEEMRKIILKSYGKKSPDGKNFIKNDQIRENFESSEAYSVLFMELVTDAELAAEFMNGIIPAGLLAEVEEVTKKDEEKPSVVSMTSFKPRSITRRDLIEMDGEEFKRVQAQIAAGEVILAE